MPKLSIGLPVYNGERFLRCAIDSILSQGFGDFELIISDNGSIDSTPDICAEYARADKRVRFLRLPRNRGASYNFNAVFRTSGSEYFKWASHDDVCCQGFFEKCLKALEKTPSAVLSHPLTSRIDQTGMITEDYDLRLETSSGDPGVRFGELVLRDHACFEVFGVIRSSALRETRLLESYSGSDRVLLAGLALRGAFCEVPERLFLRRSHEGESRRLFPERNARIEWFDPTLSGKIALSEWKLLYKYHQATEEAPISRTDALKCHLHLVKWAAKNRRNMASDVLQAIKKLGPRGLSAFSARPR